MLVIGSGLSNQNLLAFDGQSRRNQVFLRNIEETSSLPSHSQPYIKLRLIINALPKHQYVPTLADSLRCCVTTSQILISSNIRNDLTGKHDYQGYLICQFAGPVFLSETYSEPSLTQHALDSRSTKMTSKSYSRQRVALINDFLLY